MAILNNSNAISSGGYDINNSLRFRSSASAYLNRTFTTPTDNKKWTYSTWIKRSTLTSTQVLLATASEELRYISDGGASGVVDSFQYNAGAGYGFRTNATYRDVSAWYHIVVSVDTTQATAANRARIYINGVEASTDGTYNISQNTNTQINSAVAHNIARRTSGSLYFDGYQAETYFVDGQQLTPSSFGSTNSTTGVWQPAQYTGTYGTNGFYLKFSDIATTSGSNAGLGKDFSGNANYWTTNNISVTAGVTYDAMIDSPTLTSATVANYAVMNPIQTPAATVVLSNANLRVTIGAVAGWRTCANTIGVSSGKWYAEFTLTTSAGVQLANLGILSVTDNYSGNYLVGTSATSYGYVNDGQSYNNATAAAYGNTYTTGDIIGIAYNADNNKIFFSKNGVWQNSGDPAAGTNPAFNTTSGLTYYFGVSAATNQGVWDANFGQRPFSYTPPTGFVRLNTYNLPTPTILQGNKYMDATLYTGNSSTVTATNAGAFKPDLVWIKDRTSVAQHVLTDSVRGTSAQLFSSLTNAEQSNSTYVTSFNTNGFTVGVGNAGTGVVNNTGDNFVGWQWQAGQGSTSSNTSGSITSTVSVNATAGFSVVTYTGTGANATVGHGLGVAPAMIITRYRGVESWSVYHKSLGGTKTLYLDLTNAANTTSLAWNNTDPTSTVFSVGSAGTTNTSGGSGMVAYCWAEIAGFSKFGSYTGNGSTDGPFVFTGFRPKFILIKNTTTAGYSWQILDTARNTYNAMNAQLFPNSSAAEDTTNVLVDYLSNGFKLRNGDGAQNLNSNTYIYAAFAENPFRNSLAR